MHHSVVYDAQGNEILIVTISDGAGSAMYAAEAAEIATRYATKYISKLILEQKNINETNIYALTEDIYDLLAVAATNNNIAIDEYSCTILGAILAPEYAVFYQIGDGAIIRTDGSGVYTTVWWPHIGEYLNTTAFVTDYVSMPALQVVVLEETINEIALFTDGLQMLALNMNTMTVHQPFFNGMFHHLRHADSKDKIDLLNIKLAQYLDSTAINDRTDDDKTLFLATRLPA